ncbi:regulatory protein RecX [Maribacter sp. TH_r10]|uniref:regulatory protein RecX n=1 Tax=Maribacter sp. TH_r10 TaxID=3082086 RepID=UPI0029546FB5|nr:regulatory protein RecX [Maribacter sp. TH_r10]MDV7137923.1 regulatory protein RecX [Maribacter sp. TH_r10]
MISSNNLFKKTDSYTLSEATKKLERYCAYQERCHKDVTSKLKEMRMIPEAIDQIITHLIQENYLNEERFAQSFARGKFNIKKWGRNRIVNELKQRHISSYNIKSALAEIDDALYLETLDNLAKKRVDSLKETDIQKRRRKLADYLLYRGWESHLVYEKITELIK